MYAAQHTAVCNALGCWQLLQRVQWLKLSGIGADSWRREYYFIGMVSAMCARLVYQSQQAYVLQQTCCSCIFVRMISHQHTFGQKLFELYLAPSPAYWVCFKLLKDLTDVAVRLPPAVDLCSSYGNRYMCDVRST